MPSQLHLLGAALLALDERVDGGGEVHGDLTGEQPWKTAPELKEALQAAGPQGTHPGRAGKKQLQHVGDAADDAEDVGGILQQLCTSACGRATEMLQNLPHAGLDVALAQQVRSAGDG
eukprot:CAMPEP_0175450912 /NCGR_PEP_ID=MMETSP0095-20121207/62617_1 /TAXON_ID=311494 /ORGANISM="Alexandrium monilatum, Strain CCMP3105" /LENGTH=117 /DNA_ID=CAMNT_0016751405 /DNA_START=23 /DNA_END=373 /DNA_ORIENTATION=-